MQENYAKASNDSTESGAHFPRRSVFLGSVQAAAALTGGAVLGGAVVGNPAMAKEEENHILKKNRLQITSPSPKPA
ncbi:MAG: hypothetical protein VXZ82_21575 [Planctomycetota bacterium]|nr:hypothetical protein [Planctomycetota bacterium]